MDVFMADYLRKGEEEMAYGYTSIAEMNGALYPEALMDFGVLRLRESQEFEEQKDLECAYLLVYGEVTFSWNGQEQTVKRGNCFDDGLYCLWVPAGTPVKITGVGRDSELTVHRTDNEKAFTAKLFTPADVPDEHRGAGTMKETCTRIVRTVLDKSLAPESNFVFGEVINTPGKWSSYPPHVHHHPEIYYYKLFPKNGYGYGEMGDDVIKVRNNDTAFIFDSITHCQAATPGHALWYMWVIRQDEEKPYIKPYTLPIHEWVMKPEAGIWPDIPARNE